MRALCRLVGSSNGAAAVEAAIFAPIFLFLTLGIADLGTQMFRRMQVNAAAQAGAAYAVINYTKGSSPVCASMSGACLSGIRAAMNDATGDSTFCNDATCTAFFTSCAEPNGGICFIVTVSYPCNTSNTCLLLPDAVYSWASSSNYSSTVTVRVPTT